MNDIKPSDVQPKKLELQLSCLPLSRKHSKAIKACGGSYRNASGFAGCRFVFLPIGNLKLANELINAYGPTTTPVLFRDSDYNLPSWVEVQCVHSKSLDPMDTAIKGFNGSVIIALNRGLIRNPNQPVTATERPVIPPALVGAFEFGYKCCEKGMNIQAALEALYQSHA